MARTWTAWAGCTTARTGWRKPPIICKRRCKKSRTDPTVHDHLGDVYFKQGKIREAIAQWQSSLKEYEATSQSDVDPSEMAQVSKKLESARVRVAKEDSLEKEKQQ